MIFVLWVKVGPNLHNSLRRFQTYLNISGTHKPFEIIGFDGPTCNTYMQYPYVCRPIYNTLVFISHGLHPFVAHHPLRSLSFCYVFLPSFVVARQAILNGPGDRIDGNSTIATRAPAIAGASKKLSELGASGNTHTSELCV